MRGDLDLDDFDRSADPGTDFYRYVNGGWLDANPIPAEYSAWGAFEEVTSRNEDLLQEVLERAAEEPSDDLERLVGDYYVSGMAEDVIAEAGTTPLRAHLDRIDAVDDGDDLRRLAVDLHRSGIGLLFGRYVSADFEDATRNLLWLGQGGLGLPERDYYTREDEQSVGLRRDYTAHVARQLGALGDGHDEAEDAAGRILAFETLLAEQQLTPEQARDVDRTLNRRSIDELRTLMPAFDLTRYLGEAGARPVESTNVDHPPYFSALDEILASQDVSTLRDYARWHLVSATASALPPVFEEEAFAFYGRRLGGQQEQKPRWKRVLKAATGDIGEAVGKSFVALAFSEEAKQRALSMVDDIVAEMRRSLETRPWMTDATREHALAKLDRMQVKIGYPDRWRDYSGLRIDRGPYVVNRMRAAAFEDARQLAKLGEPVDRSEWLMPPHMVNAYYHPLLNEIVFPAAILQPPMFDAAVDDALNYGAIGAVIGHEITHGFDDQGRRFDAAGAFHDWWTERDAREFSARADRLATQYGDYTVLDDLKVNGRLTLGENIADLGGVAIAHRALVHHAASDGRIDGFTPSQRFFIAYARVWRGNVSEERQRMLVQVDPHSPRHLRVAGPLANYTPFAEAFDLTDEAPMLRPVDERIEIW